ncbi:ABC transporter permease [Planctomycetota bacterium]|nr:ABC transporter permease [Planctomycetota bacterium]
MNDPAAIPPPKVLSPRMQWVRAQAYALAYLTYYGMVEQYSRATLGLLWFLITPVLMIVVYGTVLTTIYRSDFYPDFFVYCLVIMGGLLPWIAFSEGLGSATMSVVQNPTVIRNSPLPPVFLPTVKVVQTFLGLFFTLIVFTVVAALTGRANLWNAWALPYAFVTLLGFTLGLSWFFAALAVYVRDVTQLISTLLLVGLFASPVLYSRDMSENMPYYVHIAIAWNPTTPYLELVRSVLTEGGEVIARDVILAPVLAIVSLMVGVFTFRKLQPGMADML